MSNSFLPTQFGYIPTGTYAGTVKTSSVFIGKNVTGQAGSDGVGLGLAGRPDYVEDVIINLTQRNTDGSLTHRATLTLNVSDVVSAIAANSNVPANLNLTLKEVSVCEQDNSGNTSEKKMIIIGSQTYAAAT